MTTEELAMMDELANDPEFNAWLEAKWEETMEGLDAVEVKKAV